MCMYTYTVSSIQTHGSGSNWAMVLGNVSSLQFILGLENDKNATLKMSNYMYAITIMIIIIRRMLYS